MMPTMRMKTRHRQWDTAVFWLLLVFISAPVSVFVSADTMYRYVNEQGVVVYSQIAPAGQLAEPMRIAPGPPTADIQAAQQRLQPPSPPANNKAHTAAMTKEQQAAIADMRNKNCVIARDNLAKLEQLGNRALIMPDGKKVYPSDAERAALIAETQQQMTENCLNKTGE